MKKILLILLATLFVLTLAGCGEKEPEKETIEVNETISKAFSDMNESFYMLSFDYDIKEDQSANYDEYYAGRLYNNEDLNFGFITCLSYLQQPNGDFKLVIDDREYESDYDLDDYFKFVSNDVNSTDATFKYCLGYGSSKNGADASEDFWNQIVLHFDKYESEGIIYGSFDTTGTLGDKEVNYTQTITLTRFNSLQDAYDMCKQLDTSDEFAD